MSIPVDLDRLSDALGDYGAGYFLTASADGSVKAVTVETTLAGGTFELPASRGSQANLAVNPRATLVFPPLQQRGYSLIVDGEATSGETRIVFTPSSAVLHRPASHADGPAPPVAAGDSCGNDCIHV